MESNPVVHVQLQNRNGMIVLWILWMVKLNVKMLYKRIESTFLPIYRCVVDVVRCMAGFGFKV